MTDPTKNLLVIDIETVSGNEDVNHLSPELKNHWQKKVGFLRNQEEKSWEELYADRAAIYAEFGKVIVIGMGFFHNQDGIPSLRVKTLASQDENKLLSSFKSFIEKKFDQHELRLCAHNGKEFDFPYLCRRMLINNLSIPWSLNMTGKKPWEVNHIDTMELWKFGDWKSFTSLDLLTTIFNIPSSKSDMDGSMVTKTYYEDKNGLKKIEEYCKRDIIATSQLFLRLHNLPLIHEDHIVIVE